MSFIICSIIKKNMPRLNLNNVLTHLLGKTRLSIGESKHLITSNPQWKISLGEAIDRNGWRELPMKEAVDNLIRSYPGVETTMRAAANERTNIDIPGIFRDRPSDPSGDGGDVPSSNWSEYLDKATKLGGLSLGAAFSVQQALQDVDYAKMLETLGGPERALQFLELVGVPAEIELGGVLARKPNLKKVVKPLGRNQKKEKQIRITEFDSTLTKRPEPLLLPIYRFHD
jgi:hypothetical protein